MVGWEWRLRSWQAGVVRIVRSALFEGTRTTGCGGRLCRWSKRIHADRHGAVRTQDGTSPIQSWSLEPIHKRRAQWGNDPSQRYADRSRRLSLDRHGESRTLRSSSPQKRLLPQFGWTVWQCRQWYLRGSGEKHLGGYIRRPGSLQ